MGTSKLTRKQFVITNFETKNITFIEIATTRTSVRSVLLDVEAEVLARAILRTNKTTYLRKLLNLMKKYQLLSDLNLRFEFTNIDELIKNH